MIEEADAIGEKDVVAFPNMSSPSINPSDMPEYNRQSGHDGMIMIEEGNDDLEGHLQLLNHRNVPPPHMNMKEPEPEDGDYLSRVSNM